MSLIKDDLRAQVIERLQFDYELKVRTGSNYMRGGTCPKCKKKELYARHENPWQIRCGRPERCGHIEHVKDLYDDLFEDWSKRAPATYNDLATLRRMLKDGRTHKLIEASKPTESAIRANLQARTPLQPVPQSVRCWHFKA